MKKLLLTLSLALIAVLANAKSTVYLRVDGTTVTTSGTWRVHYWGGASSSWPGSVMTLISDTADDGFQYFSYEIDTDATYNIIFNQGGDTWKTGDIKNLTGNVAYSLNSDKSYTRLGVVPTWSDDSDDSDDAEDESTIYLRVDGSYVTEAAAPYLYAWDGSGAHINGDWPGSAMALVDNGVAVDGYKYYSSTIANKKANFSIIFNKGDGQPQTGDIDSVKASGAWKLTGESGKNYSCEKLSSIPVWLKITAAGEKSPAWNGNSFTILSDGEQNAYKIQLQADIDDLQNGFFVEYNGMKLSTGGKLKTRGAWSELAENDTDAMSLDSDASEEIYLYVKEEDGVKMIKFLAENATSGVDAVESDAAIAVNAGEIVVSGAKKVAVYTIGGALISTDARTKVANGLYIVRADNQVKKVVVK